jgi:hypothetical protein
MRVILVVLMLASLGAAVAGAGGGCGGDTALARQYSEQGDKLSEAANVIGGQLDSIKADLQKVLVANDVAGLVAKEAEVRGIQTKIDTSIKLIDQALVQYRKVMGLSGVDKYKTYASLQMEAALKAQEALAIARDLAVFSLGAVESAKAGHPVDLTESLKTISSTVNKLDEIERQMDKTKREAKIYATDNNLF